LYFLARFLRGISPRLKDTAHASRQSAPSSSGRHVRRSRSRRRSLPPYGRVVFVLRHVRDVIRGSAQREEPTGVRQRDRTQPRGPKSSRTRLTSRSPEWDTIDRSFIFSRSSSLMPGSRASICKSVFVILISS